MNVEAYLASKQAEDLARIAAEALEASPYYRGLAERLSAEAAYIADVEGRRANRLAEV